MSRTLYNLIKGYGSILDLFPADQSMPRIGEGILAPNDAESMRRDWEAVGGDMRAAFGRVVPDDLKHVEAEPAQAEFAHAHTGPCQARAR